MIFLLLGVLGAGINVAVGIAKSPPPKKMRMTVVIEGQMFYDITGYRILEGGVLKIFLANGNIMTLTSKKDWAIFEEAEQ